jgi:urea transport system permease protein
MSSQPRTGAPPTSEVLADPVPPVGEALPLPELEKGRIPKAYAYLSLAFFLVFLAALFLPLRYPGYFDPLYRLPQFNRFMALALFALSVDMIWGYTGLLSLGQGLYFGMGAYIVAWSLKLQKAAMDASEATDPRIDRYILGPGVMPDYMMQCRLDAVPDWIAPLINIWVALALAIILPTIMAFAFGYIVFKRRIKGVYFSLITQALVLAIFYLVSNQRPYTGGVDGQNTLSGLDLFGIDFEDSKSMFYLVTGILVVFALLCYVLVHSKFGKVLTAIRDNEFRVMALGYNTAMFKTFVFALSGLMAGLAGALFVAANQTASPTFFSINDSIEVVIFVAVGGRGTLVGAIFGALLVNWGKDYINAVSGTRWPIVLGALFVAVVLFLPEGVVGGVPRFFSFLRLWFYRRPGLTARWNWVRVGVGLMYWGILGVIMATVIPATLYLVAVGPEWQRIFTGTFDSICYVTLLVGMVMAVAGQCACWALPSEARNRILALGSILAMAVFLIVGFLTLSTPLGEARRVLGLGDFGDVKVWLLAVLGVAVALSHLLLAFFLRGVALFYGHEALAKSIMSYVTLFVVFLASVVFLNSITESVRNHSILGPVSYLLSLAYVGMLITLPMWFLRLLFQTHECINRPMAAA